MPVRTEKFDNQRAVRRPWRRYLDSVAMHRGDLHRYCRRLTGNVWDGEDLMQDTLVRVFSLLGRNDARLEHPRAYLIRTATNLWIDRMRRVAREQAALAMESPEPVAEPSPSTLEQRDAARRLFQTLHPQERAAFLLKDVLDLSLEETAVILRTSVGAVKAALWRGRGRLDARQPPAGFDTPPPEILERFIKALAERDLEAMRELCSDDLTVELVGGAQTDGWEKNRNFFTYAHMTMPALGLGAKPWWKTSVYDGETVALGFRTLDGVEGLNEIHRLETSDGRIQRIRCYCFCPETLAAVAEEVGVNAIRRPYRSPSAVEFLLAILRIKRRAREVRVQRPEGAPEDRSPSSR
jgi:RNA polymerase sigma-70 factor, ECF subfamily